MDTRRKPKRTPKLPIKKVDYKDRILKTLKEADRPMSYKELGMKVRFAPKDIEAFKNALRQLKRDNKIEVKNDRFRLRRIKGTPALITRVNETFGFAKLLDETESEVFIPGSCLRGAMPKDEVMLKVTPGDRDLPVGEVLEITKPYEGPISGEVQLDEQGHMVLNPDGFTRFAITLEREMPENCQVGCKVLAQITKRGTRHFEHRAKVTQVLGDAKKAYMSALAMIATTGVHTEFTPEVEQLAEKLNRKGLDPKEVAKRVDLRDELIFTIDSADTKDIDDAVSLKKTPKGWVLGVHIADVSHYVTENSPIDQEAVFRGTSIYYADMVIPMLPKALSNGICSLNPQEDRLAFSCIASLDTSGKLVDYHFQKTVIRSRVKGVYKEINALLKGEADDEIMRKYKGLEDTLFKMSELAAILQNNRFARGSMDIDTKECKIITNTRHEVLDIVPRERGWSEHMIEEFMLVANEAAAALGRKLQLPFVYRVHEDPSPDRISELKLLAEKLGIAGTSVLIPKVRPFELSRLLNESKGQPYEKLFNTQLLRSMAKAKYDPTPIGHYGLVLNDYAHFTSPIRRYPDLAIHRILSAYLAGMGQKEMAKRYGEFVKKASASSTECEIQAMRIERDCESCYMAEYMLKHIGDQYDGIISAVTPNGMFVEIPNGVEGFIHVTTLKGEYDYDEKIALIEKASKRTFRVGDPIHIEVVSANVSAGRIDFKLSE